MNSTKYALHYSILLPVRFRTDGEAMGVCRRLGGDYLQAFSHYQQYLKFYQAVRTSPAMAQFCDHGGRFIMWLPYQSRSLNVTYYGSNQALSMNDAWRNNNPRIDKNCVVARMGN